MNLDRHLIWIAAVALGYIALAIPLIRRGRQTFASVLLSLYVVLSMAWAWSGELSIWSGLEQPWSTGARIGLVYGMIVLPALLGMLTTAFLRARYRRIWVWVIAGGVLVFGVETLDRLSLQSPQWSMLSSLSLSESASVIGWTVLSGAVYLISWTAYRKAQRPMHRNRLCYWMLITAFILMGDGLFVLLGSPYGEFGVLLHWFGAALASVALLSHHLPDLSSVARQTLRRVLLTLITALAFASGIFLTFYMVPFLPTPYAVLVSAVIASVLLAILYPPVQHWVQVLLERFLFGKGYDRERILREYSQGISNILDLDRLVAVATGIIGDAIEIRRAMLLVCEESPTFRLRPIRGLGALDVEPLFLDPGSLPVAYMLETGTPLTQYDLDLLPEFQDLTPDERSWFSRLGMEVYVPILAADQLLGILAMGAKRSGEPYSAGDIALLRTLAGQTAVALKNARLVEDLKRLNAEITQLNADLTEANERLAIVDKTKSDFISIASHELKTPLTQIKGYTDILLEMKEQESISPNAVRRAVEGISKGADRLHDVVDAMLDVSLIEQQAFGIQPLPISLAHVVSQVCSSLEVAFRERHQTVSIVGLDVLPEIIADQTRLHQALRNILINSVKFTPDAGHIGIRASITSNGEAVQLEITDTGIGIDPEHQELIFEKFYRVGNLNLHSTGQIKFKGAGPGLGLPIARGIIEAHGGRIWVESRGYDEESCPGSTFFIVLPVNGPSDLPIR